MDVAWFAGYLEGEGSFGRSKSRADGPAYPFIEVKGTDRDIVQRVADRWGVTVAVRPQPNGWQTQYRARLRGVRAVGEMRELLPYMGERRAAQIRAAADLS